ncbi:MAG: MBL fold metallo-hydrolase [Thermomicrobiales bacterium]
MRAVSAQSLGSGSSGNGLLVTVDDQAILIDCGLGPRLLGVLLAHRGLTLGHLQAVFVTHEHDDHVRGLEPLVRRKVPVFASAGTARALNLAAGNCGTLAMETPFAVGDFGVTPLPTSHDAAEPCGYAIRAGDARLTIVTDLGTVSPALRNWVAGADLIVIEANHDEHMLRSGPYPPHLKRRVASATGHLSNADCGLFLRQVLDKSGRQPAIWLAHLSATNNRPELAAETVRRHLADVRPSLIEALPREAPGPVWRYAPAPRQASLGFTDESARMPDPFGW